MTPTDDLDCLLALAADGALSDADRLQLAVLLRDDPAAQQAYREYMLLDALLRWEKPTATTAKQPTRRRRALRAAVVALAACLLVVGGVGLFLTLSPRETAAKSDVVDRLADWNLTIADAPTPAIRRERFRERADAFATELARSNLPADERKLAESLYANAQAIAAEDDPVAVAEKLDGVSEKLLEWMWAHSEADPRRAEAMERHYLRFAERNADLVRKASADGGPDDAQKRRIEKLTEKIAHRAAVRVEKEAERSRKKAGR